MKKKKKKKNLEEAFFSKIFFPFEKFSLPIIENEDDVCNMQVSWVQKTK